jgi:hypothetical protein
VKKIVFSRWSLFAACLGGASAVVAQVDYARPGSVYNQDFNKEAGWASADVKWEDNLTFPGWYAAYYDSKQGSFISPGQLGVTSGAGVGLNLYRAVTGSSNGALGSQAGEEVSPEAGVGGVFYGVQLTNKTDRVLTRFSFGYKVGLWRLASPKSQQATLMASYKVGGGSMENGAWTIIAGTSYTTPRGGNGSTASSVDGSLAENQVEFAKITVTDVKIPPGESVWIRWFDINNRGFDHGIAIDDFTFTAEP